MKELSLRTTSRIQLVNITSQVVDALQQIGGDPTLCHVHVPHTTAGPRDPKKP